MILATAISTSMKASWLQVSPVEDKGTCFLGFPAMIVQQLCPLLACHLPKLTYTLLFPFSRSGEMWEGERTFYSLSWNGEQKGCSAMLSLKYMKFRGGTALKPGFSEDHTPVLEVFLEEAELQSGTLDHNDHLDTVSLEEDV